MAVEMGLAVAQQGHAVGQMIFLHGGHRGSLLGCNAFIHYNRKEGLLQGAACRGRKTCEDSLFVVQ